MPIKSDIYFHTNAITTGSGNVFTVSNIDALSKLVIQTSASAVGSVRTLVFEASNYADPGTYFPILCTNITDGTSGSKTTSNSAESWTVSLLGLRNVRCVINAISSGSWTVYGQHVY